MDAAQKKKLTGAAMIVMSSIIVSRLTGFAREALTPNFLGVGLVSDAYLMAFRITDLMYNLLVGGAIAAAIIPILTGYIVKDQEEDGWKAAGTFINVVIISMIIVSGLGIIFAPQLVALMAIGFDKEAAELTIKLTRILFPSVGFIMLAGITNGVLNSYKRFAAAAYGPSIYNIGSALSIWLFSSKSVEAVAFGVMSSSIIYFLFQFAFAYKNLKHYRFNLYMRHSGFRRLFGLAIPSLISSAVVQINVIITNSFTSLFQSGSVTALQMADRTWQLPYGIFAQGIGIAILPTLSEKLAIGEVENYKRILLKSLKTVLFLSLPSAIGLVVLREPIIRTIFKLTKEVTEDDVRLTGAILMFYAVALLAQSAVTILNRAYYADNDTKTPLYTGVATIVFNVLFSMLFYNMTNLGTAGMALSYSLSSTLNMILLLILLNKRMHGIYLKELLSFLFKILPASIVMGAIIYILNLFLPSYLTNKLYQFINLGLMVFVGITVYAVVTISMKVDEAVSAYKAIINRAKRIILR